MDCRTEGCGKNAECIREQAVFVCRCPPGTTGRANIECTRGESTPINSTNATLTYVVYSIKAYRSTNAFVALDI